MRIGIIDADLLGRTKHRFPNLACEKISGYWIEKGAETVLLRDYDHISDYDKVYISKVFTDTPVPQWILDDTLRPSSVHIGGTGFFFDQAPSLPIEIEHHMPDYRLYDDYIEDDISKAREKKKRERKEFKEKNYRSSFREYSDYSIGFLTRGCFRKCGFCVNKKYDHVFPHSPLSEFYDSSRKKICLLDDNFLGCPRWRELLEELRLTGRQFKFKQGLDERLLTDEKCELLFGSNYDGDITFAFDNVEDYDLIKTKLDMIRRHSDSNYIKFYVLVGYKSTDAEDIENAFKRIALLMEYGTIPYVMRYQNKNDAPWRRSEYADMYIQIARWCNQQAVYKQTSFREFAERSQERHVTEGTLCAPMRALKNFELKHPEIAKQYFDKKYQRFKMRDFYAQWQMARKQSAAEGEYLAPFLNRDQETYAFLSGEYSQSQFVTILSLFQDMPTEILLNYICSHDTKCSYSTNQIPQFSDFEKGAVIVPRVLEFFPDGINFTELGRKLVDAKEKEANRKYGENHASLASLMSLASISKMERKLVYPTSLGHFLIDYQINEKDRLLKAMLLRNPFIQEMVRIAFHGGNYGCLLTELASSTARRRRQSVRHLMEFIFQDTECKEQYARIDWTV